MSAFSVNTNAGAFLALQNLSSTNRSLSTVQQRISTGLNVASTKDDSAKFGIAQNLRRDVGGFNAVQGSLNNAKSTLDVAISASEAVSDLLIQAREKAQAAAVTGLDAASITSLKNDFDSLRDQIDRVVTSATFNGINILKNADPVAGANGLAGQSTSFLLSARDADSSTPAGDGFQADLQSIANQSFSLGLSDAVVASNGSGAAFAAFNTPPAAGTAGSVIRLNRDTSFTDAASAANVVRNLDASIANVNSSLARQGSASRQIDAQIKFVSRLSDVTQTGIGNLVDADLAKESANLQALQTKQQLGLQALTIANQAPQSVLSLFR
jgi:flagellin